MDNATPAVRAIHAPRAAVMRTLKGSAFPLALALLSTVLALWLTARDGPGMSTDSFHYVAAARSLLSGEGYKDLEGRPFPYWPPLFPSLLAVPGVVGIDPVDASRFLNALAYGAIAWVSWSLFRMWVASSALALVGTLSVVLSRSLLAHSLMVLSDALFTLLVVLFALVLGRFIRGERLGTLYALAALAALASLQRYLGAAFIAAIVAVPWSPLLKATIAQRLKYTGFLAAISATPLALWMARNYLLTSTLTGFRAPDFSGFGPVQNVVGSVEGLALLFVPSTMPGLVAIPVAGAILVALTLLVVRAAQRVLRGVGEAREKFTLGIGFMLLSYLVLLVAAASIDRLNYIGSRYLVPVYPLVVLLLFMALDEAWSRLSQPFRGRRTAQTVLLVGCALWLVVPVGRFARAVSEFDRDGPPDAPAAISRNSPLMAWLRRNALDGAVYSNEPGQVYALTGILAHPSPSRVSWPESWDDGQSYLVWFTGREDLDLLPLEELHTRLAMDETVVFSDGGVYTIEGARRR